LYLDKKSVKVIDCGIPGTNLNNTLKNLDNYISDYNPDIVISMMGINDAQRQDVKIYNKKYRLKTLELLRIIKKHITADLYAENLNYNINDIMLEYIKSGKPPVILETMLKKDKNNPEILTALISVYRILKDYESTEKYANQYIENYLGKFDADVPFFLTDIYIQQKKYPMPKN
jgi:lysophospholipase L1-like esterase